VAEHRFTLLPTRAFGLLLGLWFHNPIFLGSGGFLCVWFCPSVCFWRSLLALQALSLSVDTDSHVKYETGNLINDILGICGGVVTPGYSPEACDGREEVQRPRRLLCGSWRSTALAPALRHHFARSPEGRCQRLSPTCRGSVLGEGRQWRGLVQEPAEILNEESYFAPCLAFK